MTGCGFGYSVILVRVGEPGTAFCESGESAGKLRTEPGQIVFTEPVDSDHHYKGGMLRRGGLGGCKFAANSERGEQKKGSRHMPI